MHMSQTAKAKKNNQKKWHVEQITCNTIEVQLSRE
jgi:hypothetical protein